MTKAEKLIKIKKLKMEIHTLELSILVEELKKPKENKELGIPETLETYKNTTLLQGCLVCDKETWRMYCSKECQNKHPIKWFKGMYLSQYSPCKIKCEIKDCELCVIRKEMKEKWNKEYKSIPIQKFSND